MLLERATLPSGSPAFGARELSHMRDVRTLFGDALRAQLVAVVVLAVLALALARTRLRTVVPLGLLAGALATLAVALLAVPLILLGFDGFFVRFHEVFFSGDTWRFNDADTLHPHLSGAVLAGRLAAGARRSPSCRRSCSAPLAWWWLRAARRRLA